MIFNIVKYILVTACAFCLQVQAAGAGSDDEPTKEADPGGQTDLLPTGTTDDGARGFIAMRRALIEELVQEAPDGRDEVLLGLAELSLLEGLVNEGLSYAGAISDASSPEEIVSRSRQIAAALAAIGPRGLEIADETISVLEAPGVLPYRRVFLAAGLARDGQSDEAAGLISDAMDELASVPDAVAHRVLPELLSAAVEAERWDAARALTEHFLDRGDLRHSDALDYLLGRIALHHGEGLRAFDHFLEAAGGSDVWAHRARLAIVDLAIASESLFPEEIQGMLSRVYALWRGDAEAVVVLERMLTEALKHEDTLGALDVMARIIRNYPETPVATELRGEAEALIEAYYDEGVSGAHAFEKFLAGHRQIARSYRFFETYDTASEAFADHALSLGAVGMAADEYRITREYLEASATLGVFDVDERRIVVLRLKEAKARMDAGQMERAAELLTSELSPDDAELSARLGALRARYSELTGNSLGDEENRETHSIAYLRLLAQEHFAEEDWEAARSQYLKLARTVGAELTNRDALELILAAHRSGDEALSRVLGGILGRRYELADAALDPDLLLERAIPVELRREITEASLERADRALEQVVVLSDEPDPASESEPD